MRKGIEKIKKKEGRKMARTIKIDDELFERVMEKKSQEETQIEFVNRIFLFWLEHQKNLTEDKKAESDSDKRRLKDFQNRFDDMYENINEILEKVSLNYDRLYGKNGTDQYIIQPQKVVKNVMPLKKLTEEEVKQLTADIRKKPGIIPWDKLDRILMEEKRKENEKMEQEKDRRRITNNGFKRKNQKDNRRHRTSSGET